MTEAQPMELTEFVSDYQITEEDNVRHIEKTRERSEDATEQQKPTNGSSKDPKEAKKASNGDQ